MSNKNFALIGVAGYIAQRHVKAIKETNNKLITCLDKFDNVGFLDSYFPDADFFYEFERFDRHLDMLKNTDKKIDYVSICSPNYLHDSHIRFALHQDADAICEKPLVLNPWNIDRLIEIENQTGRKIYNILQLRLHPAIKKLKTEIDNSPKDKIFDVNLAYITSRGKWYHYSWKGDVQKSGGIATNIGVHFFDMLTWIFGKSQKNTVYISDNNTAAGFLELERANVKWLLSIDENLLPEETKKQNKRAFRLIKVEDKEIEFTEGFEDLHTESYKQIIAGNGFRISDARSCIQIVHEIRNAKPIGLKGMENVEYE